MKIKKTDPINIIRNLVFSFLFAFIITLTAGNSLGAEGITIRPEISIAESYNDNVYFIPEPGPEAPADPLDLSDLLDDLLNPGGTEEPAPEEIVDDYYTTITPSLTIESATEKTKVKISGAADIKRYSHEDQLDNEYGRTTLKLNYKPTERVGLNFDGYYKLTSALESDLEETGMVYSYTDVDIYELKPSLIMSISDLYSISLIPIYKNTSYENPNLLDYEDYIGMVDFRRKISKGASAYVALQGLGGFTDTEIGEAKYYGAGVRWHTVPFAFLATDAFGGFHRTTLDYEPEFVDLISGTITSEDYTAPAYEISLTSHFSEVSVSCSFSNFMDFGGTYTLEKAKRIKVTGKGRLTEKLTGSVGALLARSKSISSYDQKDEDLGSFSGSLTYKVMEKTSVTASFQHDTVEDNDDAVTRDRNIFSLKLTTYLEWQK